MRNKLKPNGEPRIIMFFDRQRVWLLSEDALSRDPKSIFVLHDIYFIGGY